ncbi:Rid family hydrolase [Allobranchiibius huperziae]|uniref:Enamine deaminase RidA (YjgF/YER057c/UK114 family) n=1 Tax=Allobranchiibius huperziae TaxID=1874116 RepID=A0A853DLF5_9MICO|nr:enamine deaminase RidA (YjgF/YER057c/UK114 family) [Allobranchiibius huperziae]
MHVQNARGAPAGSRWIFLAGSCPLDDEGGVVGRGDVAAQAHQVMRNLQVALADAGAELRDVVSTRVLVASAERSDLVTAVL